MKKEYFVKMALWGLTIGLCGQVYAAAPHDAELAMSKCTRTVAPEESQQDADEEEGCCGQQSCSENCSKEGQCGGGHCNMMNKPLGSCSGCEG